MDEYFQYGKYKKSQNQSAGADDKNPEKLHETSVAVENRVCRLGEILPAVSIIN